MSSEFNAAGNSRYLKQLNQSRILKMIKDGNFVSRSDLAAGTGLSATAVGQIVSELITLEYIRETGKGSFTGGRRRTMLELQPATYYSYGIDIERGSYRLVLVDITGKLFFENEYTLIPDISFTSCLDLISQEIEETSNHYNINCEKILGVGVSVPGFIDRKRNRIITAPNMDWHDVEIPKHIPQFPNIPLYLQNESNASAVYEHWAGVCRGVDDFICINIKSGIGAGIFIGGQLFSGLHGTAGEIGHIVVKDDGPHCGCGNFGCLETLASSGSIIASTRKLLKQGSLSTMMDCSDIDSLTLDDIINAAYRGDAIAKGLLLETSGYIGRAICSLVNILNPEKVVLGKDFIKYSSLVIEHIKHIVMEKALHYSSSMVEITTTSAGESSSAFGAAIFPLKEQVFEFSGN